MKQFIHIHDGYAMIESIWKKNSFESWNILKAEKQLTAIDPFTLPAMYFLTHMEKKKLS